MSQSPSMASPTVCIGIVSYRTPEDLRRCLESIPAAAEGLNWEVVVVDNDSGDESVDVAREFNWAKVIADSENRGYGRAMNRAFSRSRADVLVALNPDAAIPPGGLSSLVERLMADPTAGIVVPKLLNEDGSVQHSIHRFPSARLALTTGLVPHRFRRGSLGRRMWLEGFADTDRGGYVDWAVGALHVIRRQALGRPNAYSERSFMYAEDLEICWRVAAQGWHVLYEPSVTVTHRGNAAGGHTFGGARESRWIDATYDWYVDDRGAAAARAWAAANSVGLAAKLATTTVKGDDAHRAAVAHLFELHRSRISNPRGDQHSRRPPESKR